ncbi:hypothetical protein [Nitrospira calida]|jgi:hypothetical protein
METIVWRPSPESPLLSAEVPHLEPIRRAIRAGDDRPVRLPDGRRIRPSQLVSAARREPDGRLVAAWAVRRHGLDGAHEWRAAWRRVAAATSGLTPADPRWTRVQETLGTLDAAWTWRDVFAWDAAEATLLAVVNAAGESESKHVLIGGQR